MASVNKVILLGNLGNSPEIRSMQNGERVAQLSLATSESWKDRNSGVRKEKTEWHRVVIFNQSLVDLAEKYLDKGSKIYIEGQLQTRRYTDKTGVDKYTTEVLLKNNSKLVMIDGKKTQPEIKDAIDAYYENPSPANNGIDYEIPF